VSTCCSNSRAAPTPGWRCGTNMVGNPPYKGASMSRPCKPAVNIIEIEAAPDQVERVVDRWGQAVARREARREAVYPGPPADPPLRHAARVGVRKAERRHARATGCLVRPRP
jgi:hypothetical protein